MERLDALIAKSRVTIFHSVSPITARALASAPSSVRRVWSGWGGDYYDSTFDPDAGLLGASTRRLLDSTVRPTFYAGRAVFAIRYGPILHAAARAADIFSAPVPADLEVFRKRFPGFRETTPSLTTSAFERIASLPTAIGYPVLTSSSVARLLRRAIDIESFQSARATRPVGTARGGSLSYGKPFPCRSSPSRRGGAGLAIDSFPSPSSCRWRHTTNSLLSAES